MLSAAFRGELTAQSKDGFSRVQIGEITTLVTKGASPNWQGFAYSNEGILFIRSQNIGWGKYYCEVDIFTSSVRGTTTSVPSSTVTCCSISWEHQSGGLRSPTRVLMEQIVTKRSRS